MRCCHVAPDEMEPCYSDEMEPLGPENLRLPWSLGTLICCLVAMLPCCHVAPDEMEPLVPEAHLASISATVGTQHYSCKEEKEFLTAFLKTNLKPILLWIKPFLILLVRGAVPRKA